MESWNFKLKNRPAEIIEKLESELNAIGGFAFNKENPTTFNFRKRILFIWYLAFQNWTVAHGKLSENRIENTTDIKISFNQHFIIRLILSTHIILGLGLLIGLFVVANNNPSVYILGTVIFILGILLFYAANKKLKKDTEKYKSLITEIFSLR